MAKGIENKERALTLEAIRAGRHRPPWAAAAAADELGKVPSALSYHGTKAGRRAGRHAVRPQRPQDQVHPGGPHAAGAGRVLLEAAEHLVGGDPGPLPGWETDITIAVDAPDAGAGSLPLVDRLAEQTDTWLRFRAEVLAGSWECLRWPPTCSSPPSIRYRHDRHRHQVLRRR